MGKPGSIFICKPVEPIISIRLKDEIVTKGSFSSRFPKNSPNEQQVVRVLRWFLDRKVATYHRGYWLWDHYRSETKQS